MQKILIHVLSASLCAAPSIAWAAGAQAEFPQATVVPRNMVLGHVIHWMTNALQVHLQGPAQGSGIVAKSSMADLRAALADSQGPPSVQAVDHQAIAWFLPQAMREHSKNPPMPQELMLPAPKVFLRLAAAQALDGQEQRVALTIGDSPLAEGELRPVAMSAGNAERILAQGTEVLRRYHEMGKEMAPDAIYAAAEEIWDHALAHVNLQIHNVPPGVEKTPALSEPKEGWHVQASGALTGKEGNFVLHKLIGHAMLKLAQADMDLSKLPAVEEQVLPEVFRIQLLYKRPLQTWLERQIDHRTAKNGVDIESVSAAAAVINRTIDELNRQAGPTGALLPLVNIQTDVYVLSDFWGEYELKIARHLKAQGNLPNLREVGAFYHRGHRFLTEAFVREASPRQLVLGLWKLHLIMAGRTPEEAQELAVRIAEQAFGKLAPSLDFENLISIANVPTHKRKPPREKKADKPTGDAPKKAEPTPGPDLKSLRVTGMEKENTKGGNKYWYLVFEDGHGWEMNLGINRLAKERKIELFVSWFPEGEDEDHTDGIYFLIVADDKYSESEAGIVAASLFARDLYDGPKGLKEAMKRYLSTDSEDLIRVKRFMDLFEKHLRRMGGGPGDPVPAES